MSTIEGIVRAYTRRFGRQGKGDDVRFFESLSTLDDVIHCAGMAEDARGKRWSHQRRIPRRVLLAATTRLMEVELADAMTFEELHDRVEAAVKSIKGIGDLYVYDTALRIGAFLKLEPNEVFLHAGTRNGAKMIGLGRGVNRLPREAFPDPIRRLPAADIEDLLCIFKRELSCIDAQI